MNPIDPNTTRPPGIEATIAAPNRNTFMGRLTLFGVGIFAALCTVAWVFFLGWVVWSGLLWVGNTLGPEAKLPAGCFQSEIDPGVSEQLACS